MNMDPRTPDRITQALRKAPPAAPGVLFVDLAALRRNYRALKTAAPDATVAAVVKANAYGLGVAEVVKALRREGADIFFVATLTEAEAVRALCREQIYVLNGLPPGTAPRFSASAITPVLGSAAEFEEWRAYGGNARGFRPTALHFDTGMTRLGIAPEAAEAIFADPALS